MHRLGYGQPGAKADVHDVERGDHVRALGRVELVHQLMVTGRALTPPDFLLFQDAHAGMLRASLGALRG